MLILRKEFVFCCVLTLVLHLSVAESILNQNKSEKPKKIGFLSLFEDRACDEVKKDDPETTLGLLFEISKKPEEWSDGNPLEWHIIAEFVKHIKENSLCTWDYSHIIWQIETAIERLQDNKRREEQCSPMDKLMKYLKERRKMTCEGNGYFFKSTVELFELNTELKNKLSSSIGELLHALMKRLSDYNIRNLNSKLEEELTDFDLHLLNKDAEEYDRNDDADQFMKKVNELYKSRTLEPCKSYARILGKLHNQIITYYDEYISEETINFSSDEESSDRFYTVWGLYSLCEVLNEKFFPTRKPALVSISKIRNLLPELMEDLRKAGQSPTEVATLPPGSDDTLLPGSGDTLLSESDDTHP